MGVRPSVDKSLHEAALAESNPSIEAVNEVGDVVTDKQSYGLLTPENTVEPARTSVLGEQTGANAPTPDESTPEITFGSKEDRNYDIMDGWKKPRKVLSSLDARLGRAKRKLQTEQKRLQLKATQDAIKRASSQNKLLESRKRYEKIRE